MKRIMNVAALAVLLVGSWSVPTAAPRFRFKIRTITAGVNLKSTGDTATIRSAIGFLDRAKKKFEDAGYEIETTRIAAQPLPQYLGSTSRTAALEDLKSLDREVGAKNVILNIGPVLTENRYDPDLAAWAARLVQETKNINFSVTVASAEGIYREAAKTASEVIVALSRAKEGGVGNFRFTASANIPPGSPFFPAGYHQGQPDFAIGCETPNLLKDAFTGSAGIDDAKIRLKALLEKELTPVEKIAVAISKDEKRVYSGIDVSPAPLKGASIGEAIEALTHKPFGSAGTLEACAAITDVLHNLNVKRCGYSGLMLPVLEDPILAQRASEGRYGIRELLLYSSVCGTGLDVVPLPGAISADEMARLIRDVAALSVKLHKPLSARLFPIPGKRAGDRAEFNDPFLNNSVVMKLD